MSLNTLPHPSRQDLFVGWYFDLLLISEPGGRKCGLYLFRYYFTDNVVEI